MARIQKAVQLVAVVFFFGLLASCGGTTDTPLVVASSTPADGTYPVAINSHIEVTLEGNIDPATVVAGNVVLSRVVGLRRVPLRSTVLYQESTQTLVLTPVRHMTHYSTYEVSFPGVANFAGVTGPTTPISFRTYTNGIAREITYAIGVISGYYTHAYNSDGHKTNTTFYNGAGTDTLWFTSDDVVNYLQNFHLDDLGNTLYWEMFNDPSGDGVWGTADDVMNQRSEVEFTPKGLLRSIIDFDGPGPDGIWGTADDRGLAYTTRTYDADGNLLTLASSIDPGSDGSFQTADDVFAQFDKYEYDTAGNQTRSIYYDSPGFDAIWGNSDDGVFYYTNNQYNADNNITLYYSNASPGADGVWFNADDEGYAGWVNGEYTFDTNGVLLRAVSKTRGADLLFMTADDVYITSYLNSYDLDGFYTGVLKWIDTLTPNGLYDTGEGVNFYFKNTNNALGNKLTVNFLVGAGVDTFWFTLDDVKAAEYEYDTAH